MAAPETPARDRSASTNKPENEQIEAADVPDPPEGPADEKQEQSEGIATTGKRELKEADEYQHLGYSYATWRKWLILTVMFLIQISINLNASLYANAVDGVSEKFGVSKQAARVPQLTFLCAYAFALLLVNIWQFPCAYAPNYGTLVVCRLLGGLLTAGGSIPLGVLADMWEPDDQEYAIAFLVLSSVGGSVVGAVVGGFVKDRQSDLAWIFYTQLIAGGAVQVLHFFLVPESRSTIILDRLAKKRRKAGEDMWGPNEVKKQRMSFKEVMIVWSRPFYMLITEHIVAWLLAVSGFSGNLIFIFLQGFQPVYKQWRFGTIGISLAFIPLLIGYILAYLSFLPSIHMFRQRRRKHGSDSVTPEARLWWLRYLILLEPIGLIGFAWASLGPPRVHWITPMIFSSLVGVANYAIYQSSVDYTVAAYGVYAASATGGNDFARDFLSGLAAIYSAPMYANIGDDHPLEWASTILAIIALFVTTPVFYFYKYGPEIRMRSKFAAEIARAREEGAREGGTGTVGERMVRCLDMSMYEFGGWGDWEFL